MFRIPQDEQMEGEENNLETHSTELALPVFNACPQMAISVQPQFGETSYPGTRRPIPVSTIDWQSTNVSQFIPMHGLDFLSGTEQVNIQQTVELNDLLSNVESENRYTIKVPQGETLYYANETSGSCQRLCFGSSRSFNMRLYDQTQQEAIEIRRRLACGSCSFLCYLQMVEVWTPPGDFVGLVQQKMTFSTPSFLVYNRHHELIYRIEGPAMCACVMNGKDAHFKLYSSDGMTQLGSINHQWDQVQVAYNLCVQFPGRSTDNKHKALLIGAAFLLEYMYFERAKKAGCCSCAC